MNRSYRSLLIAFLAGAVVFLAGLAWAQTKVQTQNPPQKKVVEQKKEEPPEEYTEEEYNAYQAAADEKDVDKKAALIIAFVEKYPKSKLLPNINPLYDTLLYELNKAGEYKKLEQHAEAWLKLNPNNLQIQAYIFDAAVKLSNHQKAAEYGEKIYAQKPSADLASVLYNAYDKLGNKAKKLEWHLKLLEMPEFNDHVDLRWSLVVEYADKDLPKAAGYADQTLKALAIAKKPANVSDAEWSKTTRSLEKGSLDIMGMNYFQQKKYPQAIETLQKALAVECYDAGYYYIAQSQWAMGQAEDAYNTFAVAELINGKMSSQAKKHLVDLYKSQHDGNETGIDKVYRRAKATLEAACKK
jgi:tetratricopeptide (TPR) repeat protein